MKDKIKIINDLEVFVFEKICSSFISPARFNSAILKATDYASLRHAIYTLHDQGMFKETESEKVTRLSTAPVKTFFPDKDGNFEVQKLDYEYLPKHYHEILEGIKNFKMAVKSENSSEIEIFYRSILQSYSLHYDSYNLISLPENLRVIISQTKNSYLSQKSSTVEEEVFIKFTEKFIENYQNNKAALWKILDISNDQRRILNELKVLSDKTNGPFKNAFEERQIRSKIRDFSKIKNTLIQDLIEYLTLNAEPLIINAVTKMYKIEEKNYRNQIIKINQILRLPSRKILNLAIKNKKQLLKVISKNGHKFTPALKARIQVKLKDKKERHKDTMKGLKKQSEENQFFKINLQHYLVENLTGKASHTEQLIDLGLFSPTQSIHNKDFLEELKVKFIRSKSDKNKKRLKNTLQTKSNRNLKKILMQNRNLFERLINLLD